MRTELLFWRTYLTFLQKFHRYFKIFFATKFLCNTKDARGSGIPFIVQKKHSVQKTQERVQFTVYGLFTKKSHNEVHDVIIINKYLKRKLKGLNQAK